MNDGCEKCTPFGHAVDIRRRSQSESFFTPKGTRVVSIHIYLPRFSHTDLNQNLSVTPPCTIPLAPWSIPARQNTAGLAQPLAPLRPGRPAIATHRLTHHANIISQTVTRCTAQSRQAVNDAGG